MKKSILLSSLFLVFLNGFSQTEENNFKEDVKSIDAIIHAYYDVICGSSDDPWQFERDKNIHMENALIIRAFNEGKADVHSIEAEYIPLLSNPRRAFYETEINRVTQKFGTIAQVWSTFEMKTAPDVTPFRRGINSIQLYFSEDRWWIASWSTHYEDENTPIPELYLKK